MNNMETKTKDGKYFSQLGTWSQLVRIVILAIVYKTLGIVAVTIAVIILWGVPALYNKFKGK